MLAADGTVIIKFFLDISKKEQKARFKALEKSKDTRWRVTAADWAHHDAYERLRGYFDEAIARTDRPYAPWYRIDAQDKKLSLIHISGRPAGRSVTVWSGSPQIRRPIAAFGCD